MRVVRKVVLGDLIRTYHPCLLDMFSRKFAQVSRKNMFFSRKIISRCIWHGFREEGCLYVEALNHEHVACKKFQYKFPRKFAQVFAQDFLLATFRIKAQASWPSRPW